jgi:hypothetical protein
LKPLPPFEIRDLNREIQERLQTLKPMQELVVVKSFKKGKCYGIGLNDPEKDLVLRNLVRLIGGLFRPRPDADLTTSITLYDNTNTARSLNISINFGGGGSGANVFNYSSYLAPYGRVGTVLGFGNPATAPTPARTDHELASLVTTITPSSTTIDETNWRVTVTGSYVWTAGGTVRETGLYGNFCYGNGTWALFLLYHDAVNDVVVPAGGTVSVTYTTQF